MPIFIKDFAHKQHNHEGIKKKIEKERLESLRAKWAREEARNKEICEKMRKIQYDPTKDDLLK